MEGVQQWQLELQQCIGSYITGPGEPLSFRGSEENEIFQRWFSGDATTGKPGSRFDFACLMTQAKQLRDSNHALRTLSELGRRRLSTIVPENKKW